ncbi:hypothetical protein DTO271D3_8998 [Paecilomyces variotii]|nr:hypothetical protein DTO169C6_6344 [Paecilomyces variotii]KAJ9310744.1 hypothetical protein DTO271D3_8998 [Paecilomyces variotii]KAJ9352575.1 hypothetical protein DTO280E4_7697 [Paecilomyces variotii]KAJ9382135.1 hypothetical protein DTO063F5_5834 [Paecilomyces variotii]
MDDDYDRLAESLFSISLSLLSVPADFELDAAEKEAKDRLSRYMKRSPSDDTQRVLTSFIEYLPARGKLTVSKFITASQADDRLFELAEHFSTAIFIPMRAHGGKTPAVTPSPLDDAELEIDAEQQRLKTMCLKRDGYRCVITGFYDYEATKVFSAAQIGSQIIDTQLAHIIPYSVGKYDKNHGQEVKIARTWATLYALFPDLRDKANFTADDINHPSNAMPLFGPLHTELGRLNLALEPTDKENTYVIRTYHGFRALMFRDLPLPNKNNERIVTFNKHDDYDLPSPVLLSTHATIAKILHASGKAESIDEILRDRSELRCLAPDGSTSNLALLLSF